MPPSRKRPRHRAAVSGMMPMRCAICLFSSPAAANSTIRALSTTRAGWERARASRCKAVLCSGSSRIAGAVRMISPSLVWTNTMHNRYHLRRATLAAKYSDQ